MPDKTPLSVVFRSLDYQIEHAAAPADREKAQALKEQLVHYLEHHRDELTRAVAGATSYIESRMDQQDAQLADLLREARTMFGLVPTLQDTVTRVDQHLDALQGGLSQVLDRMSKVERNTGEHDRRLADLHNRIRQLEQERQAIQQALDEVAQMRKEVARFQALLKPQP